jgi:hypothetical protein
MADDKIKVLYIAGWGRSGSTLWPLLLRYGYLGKTTNEAVQAAGRET